MRLAKSTLKTQDQLKTDFARRHARQHGTDFVVHAKLGVNAPCIAVDRCGLDAQYGRDIGNAFAEGQPLQDFGFPF